jgi:hypothetical protein
VANPGALRSNYFYDNVNIQFYVSYIGVRVNMDVCIFQKLTHDIESAGAITDSLSPAPLALTRLWEQQSLLLKLIRSDKRDRYILGGLHG